MKMDIKGGLLRLTEKKNIQRFAVVVAGDQADSLRIPAASILESWDEPDGTVMFIMESQDDLRTMVGTIPGVRDIEKM